MAHTSVFDLPGVWNPDADARYFVEWIDDLLAKDAVRGREDLIALYRRAREFYASKLRTDK